MRQLPFPSSGFQAAPQPVQGSDPVPYLRRVWNRRMVLRNALALFVLCVVATVPCSGQAAASQQAPEAQESTESGEALTLQRIMAHPDWLGNGPEDAYWSDDAKSVYYTRKRQGEDQEDLWRLDLATGQSTRIEDADLGHADADGGRFSRDRSLRAYTRAGDVFVKDMASGQERQLTRTAVRERQPYFLADGQHLAYFRGSELMLRDLQGGLEIQPAELRTQDDPAEEEEGKGLEAKQLELFSYLRLQKTNREADRERERTARNEDPTRLASPWYLGKKVDILRRSLSPSGDWMLVILTPEKRDEGRRDQMPRWITESGYVDLDEVRPKVGTHDDAGERLLRLDLGTHEQHELDLAELTGIAEDPLAEIRESGKAWLAARRAAAEGADASASTESDTDAAATDAVAEESKGKRKKKDRRRNKEADAKSSDDEKGASEGSTKAEPRSVEFEGLAWSPDGQYAAVQAHSRDNKDRWIALVQRDSPELKTIHRLHDEAWVNWYYNSMDWLPEGHQLYFLSEESGWSQLYLYDVASEETRRLTQGDFVVSEPQLSPDGRWIYYSGNPEHPGRYNVYRVEISSGRNEQLTNLQGRSSARLSPDGQQLLITHSTTTQPPELYLQAAQPGATPRRLTHTVSQSFQDYDWVAPQIVGVPSSHQDRPIYSRLYLPRPEDRQPGPEGRLPAVVFVHGAGYLQNAHEGWSGYFREFMFHTYLTRQGYVVLDMDYRASRGYGRDWRTAIYRHMGKPELEDLLDGVDWLVDQHQVDPQRVGIYGGSYGGFMAFMALFKAPEAFAAGAALRPVTDWAHYNHPYTSNILNNPEDDPEAYFRSSPIEYAEGLSKPLLICAPMVDDNVLFLDSVRLVQRLIELEKEDFEIALYPVEPHGFRQPSSWLDEYRRIDKLFRRYLWP